MPPPGCKARRGRCCSCAAAARAASRRQPGCAAWATPRPGTWRAGWPPESQRPATLGGRVAHLLTAQLRARGSSSLEFALSTTMALMHFITCRRPAGAILIALCIASLGGCAVVTAVDTAASVAISAAGLAADAAIGTVRLTGKAVGAAADLVLPGPAGQ